MWRRKRKKREKKFCCLCGCNLKACCIVLRLWGGELVVCIMPVWRQACSFVLRLWGSKLVVLYYACVAAEKEKKKKKREKKKFCYLCGCKLKACCFVLRLWGVCFTSVERRACSFVACMVTSLWFYHACMALCLCFI